MHRTHFSWIAALLMLLSITAAVGAVEGEKKKLVIIAGKPSHPPGMHEFNAGVQLIAKCLANQHNSM